MDYIHISLHSWGFNVFLQKQAYEHDLHMKHAYQSDNVTRVDKRIEHIYTLYSNVRDYYLEILGHDTTSKDGSKIRDLDEQPKEEMDRLNNWVNGQYTRYQYFHKSALSNKICWGQCDKERADRAYRTYLARLDICTRPRGS